MEHPFPLRGMASVLPMDYPHIFQSFFFFSKPSWLSEGAGQGILLVSRWVVSVSPNTQKFGMLPLVPAAGRARNAGGDAARETARVGNTENREVGKQPGLSPTSHRQLWDCLGGSSSLRGLGRLWCWGWDESAGAGMRNP